MECADCEKTFSRYDLSLCPICHKKTCESCGRAKGGKKFCSQFCAESFFYGDSDEDEAAEIDE